MWFFQRMLDMPAPWRAAREAREARPVQIDGEPVRDCAWRVPTVAQ